MGHHLKQLAPGLLRSLQCDAQIFFNQKNIELAQIVNVGEDPIRPACVQEIWHSNAASLFLV